jgi:predicted ATPase/class 3 adenylate cyclase
MYEVRTFLLTDLAESTALWESDPVAMSTALALHDELIGGLVARAGGRLIRSKGEGDSTFSVFSDPIAAVVTGRFIVDALAEISWPTSRPLVARVGVHVGPAERRGANWFGSTVNRAARIRSLAPAGEVLVSGALAGLVGDSLGSVGELVFLGRRRLRGLSEPEELWAVVAHGAEPPRIPHDAGGTNLHRPDHELVGRADAVEQLQHLLGRHRLVTVTGAGGTGKTRLAVEVALLTRDAFRDGVWMADLVNVSAGGVLAAVLSTVGGTTATTLDSIAELQVLILLDNCEHVLDDAAVSLTALLRAAPDVKVLATSRQALSLGAEAAFPLSPLPVPAVTASLPEQSSYASYQLFVERAQLVNPSFGVGEEESEPLARCLSLLEGMPLGIEIAASQTGAMSLRRLADALARDLPRLRTGRRDAVDRHRSVAATIQWSLDLLASADADVLDALSVCRGFDHDIATAVTGRSDVDLSIGRLIEASLVMPQTADRFRILEPVRQHAANRLTARGLFDEHAERLAIHVAAVARRLRQRLYIDPTARRQMRYNTGNIEQSLNWLLERERICEAVGLIGAMGDYWFTEDQATGLRWLRQIEPQLDQCDPAVSAHARLALGMHRQGSGEDCAIPQLAAAMRSFAQAGRRGAAAKASFWSARELALDDERPINEARAAMSQALELAEAADDLILASWSQIWLGLLADRAGDANLAESYLNASLRVARTAGARHPVGSATGELARLAQRRGDIAEARRLGARAVALNREFGDPWQLLGQLLLQARICIEDHDLTQAALYLDEASPLATKIGSIGQIAETVAVAAVLLDALGMTDAATSAAAAAQYWWQSGTDGMQANWLKAILGPLLTIDQPIDMIVAPPSIRAELRKVIDLLNRETAAVTTHAR